LSRDLQRNFQNPEADIERRTAAHITQYLQASVFAQKRRVTEAEESLSEARNQEGSEDIRSGTKKAQ
jgi:hypothetical protein